MMPLGTWTEAAADPAIHNARSLDRQVKPPFPVNLSFTANLYRGPTRWSMRSWESLPCRADSRRKWPGRMDHRMEGLKVSFWVAAKGYHSIRSTSSWAVANTRGSGRLAGANIRCHRDDARPDSGGLTWKPNAKSESMPSAMRRSLGARLTLQGSTVRATVKLPGNPGPAAFPGSSRFGRLP
jgi:hypothetical protein